jgi:hypothetical protein
MTCICTSTTPLDALRHIRSAESTIELINESSLEMRLVDCPVCGHAFLFVCVVFAGYTDDSEWEYRDSYYVPISKRQTEGQCEQFVRGLNPPRRHIHVQYSADGSVETEWRTGSIVIL